MRMSESTERVLRSRSRSIVRERRISTGNVTSDKITEEEFIWKKSVNKVDNSSHVIRELGNHEPTVLEDRLHGNGDVEINDNLLNENYVRGLDDEDSPWQNGRYKPVSEIVTYYKSLGDWWNVLPKTDNTYNPMSKWYRKEIAPGIPMIPNMARPPLYPHTPKSSFFSWFVRDQSKTSTASSSLFSASSKDKGTSSGSSSSVQVSWYRKLVTTVVTVVITVCSTITDRSQILIRRTPNVNGVHAQRLKGRQLFQEANAWWRIPFVWLYRLMMHMFAADIGIMSAVRRSASRMRHSRTGIEFITLFLLLLPLLIFVGLYRDQFPNHKALLVETMEKSKAGVAHIGSSFHDWGAGIYSSIVSYWSASNPSSSFESFTSSVAAAMTSVGHSIWQFILYLYSFLLLLPALLPSFPTTSWQTLTTTTTTQSSGSEPPLSRDQLIAVVQEAVRDTLSRQDSAAAILVEDTILNSPRLRMLLDRVLADKMSGWHPSDQLLSSDQWRSAVKEAVHVYHVQNPDKEKEIINQRIDTIEKELNDRISRLEGKMDLLVDKFVTRKTVEDAIKNLTRHFNYQLKIEGEHVTERILTEITEKVKDEVTTLFYSLKRNHNQVELTTPGEVNLTLVQDYVSVMIERALCLYDADKTGMVDYALESSGGHVLNTRCTESYNAGHQTYVLFGFALWRSSNSPRTLIQPGMHPGECWAFSGQQGYVVLQLSSTIIVSGFTVEHIPRSLAPHGRIDSAPKDFSVWGLRDEDDKEETFLGRYRFHENGTSLQMFKANHVEDPFRLVELKIESNHGNLEYTCLYRFRVHGVPVS